MDRLFLTIIDMSMIGAFIIAAVCLVRLLLKKAPKIISYGLWAIAWFRLVFPFSFESVLSLIPYRVTGVFTPRVIVTHQKVGEFQWDPAQAPTEIYADVASLAQSPYDMLAVLWLVGVAFMVIYGAASYIKLKQRMESAIHVEGNIYEISSIQSPFVLGIFKPRIYIPLYLIGQEREYIILHERIHIRRRDHIVKFAAYFILCLHWFNPLVWLAFYLMGVDMEMSCDERVLKEVGSETKKDYSLSLLSLAANRRFVAGNPLAFSEGGLKARIKNVLKFRKRSRIVVVAAVILAAAMSIGFAFDRSTYGTSITMDEVLERYNRIQIGEGIKQILLSSSFVTDCIVLIVPSQTEPLREPSVSVMLKLENDDRLSDSQLQWIVEIIRGYVPGIASENITIADSSLNYYPISGGSEGSRQPLTNHDVFSADGFGAERELPTRRVVERNFEIHEVRGMPLIGEWELYRGSVGFSEIIEFTNGTLISGDSISTWRTRNGDRDVLIFVGEGGIREMMFDITGQWLSLSVVWGADLASGTRVYTPTGEIAVYKRV